MPSPVHKNRNPGTSAIAAALAALNDALQGPRGPTLAATAPGAKRPAMVGRDLPDHAGSTMRAVVEAGSRRMATAPWRISRAVYPTVRAVWPVDGKDAAAVLADCRRSIAAERERSAHWSFDFNRLMALQQAERALERILVGSAVGARPKATGSGGSEHPVTGRGRRHDSSRSRGFSPGGHSGGGGFRTGGGF